MSVPFKLLSARNRSTYMVLPPFCLEAVGFAFMAAEEPLAALLAALRAFTSLRQAQKQNGGGF